LREKNHEITLPKELQKQMLKFFMETSMPRIKKEKERLLSDKKAGGGEKDK